MFDLLFSEITLFSSFLRIQMHITFAIFLWTLERLSLNMLNTYLKNTHFYHRLSWDIRILPVYSSVKVSHSLRRRLDPHLLSNLSLSQMLRNKLKGINKETYIYLLSIMFLLNIAPCILFRPERNFNQNDDDKQKASQTDRQRQSIERNCFAILPTMLNHYLWN